MLELIGFVLTAIGTVITIWQAWSARNAAKSAKEYRDELIADRLRAGLTDLITTLKRAREHTRTLLRPAIGNARRGLDHQKPLDSVQDGIDFGRELVGKFDIAVFIPIIDQLEIEARNYRNSDILSEQQHIADEIHSRLNDFVSAVSGMLNVKI